MPVKVLPASWGDAPAFRERLKHEATLLQRIDHPGIIKVLGLGEAAPALGGGFYIAMEWLPHALDRMLTVVFADASGSNPASGRGAVAPFLNKAISSFLRPRSRLSSWMSFSAAPSFSKTEAWSAASMSART